MKTKFTLLTSLRHCFKLSAWSSGGITPYLQMKKHLSFRSMKAAKTVSFIFMFLFAACNKEEASHVGIDSIIQIESKEVLAGPYSRILLTCRTEKEYTCSNNKILSSKQVSKKGLRIAFNAIQRPTICSTALGPATTEIDLGTLSNGEYQIELNTANSENRGLLLITPREIRLEFDQQHGIDILTPVIQR